MTDLLFHLVYLTTSQAIMIKDAIPGVEIKEVSPGEYAIDRHGASKALRAAMAMDDRKLESALRSANVNP
jgi:hypothetical protein